MLFMKSVMAYKRILLFICVVFLGETSCPNCLFGQEFTAALPSICSSRISNNTAQKTTALSLPFFEDFTNYGSAPNSALWKDHSVYISNTMSGNQFSRGMAVFDANNAATVPYDSIHPYHLVWADSLTSQDIDLSSYHSSDSLWLSFYYEPGGNGFQPKPEDSFVLFFYNSNDQWVRVWETANDSDQLFKRVMIAITDTGYFHNHFAFRFVNKATHGISNSDWDLDYIYLDAHRHYADTAINDLAFTTEPSSLLNDFTAMPYNQFETDPARFLADSIHAFLRNNGSLSASVSYGFQAKEMLTGTTFSGSTVSNNLQGLQTTNIGFPAFSFSNFNPPATSNGKVIIQTKYFTSPLYPNEHLDNDTIVRNQVFDNYFAYDDGTAEKAYFLKLFQTAPGITALEYYLYAPDTLRGVAIYFPRTVPPSNYKDFSLIVYKNIAINGGTDQIIYQQDLYLPDYQDSVNKFHVYQFDQPVPMDTGLYYIGVMQDAGGFSDSLYIGLDVNRTNGNHRYFNVDGTWQPSLIQGALMVRPVLGAPLPGNGIHDESAKNLDWSLFPNPANKVLNFSSTKKMKNASFQISDMLGRILLKGKLDNSQKSISVQNLTQGIYFFDIIAENGARSVRKFIKN